eukprot:6213946-Pleurochrysis_carterae.AAC.2
MEILFLETYKEYALILNIIKQPILQVCPEKFRTPDKSALHVKVFLASHNGYSEVLKKFNHKTLEPDLFGFKLLAYGRFGVTCCIMLGSNRSLTAIARCRHMANFDLILQESLEVQSKSNKLSNG